MQLPELKGTRSEEAGAVLLHFSEGNNCEFRKIRLTVRYESCAEAAVPLRFNS